MDHTHAAEEHVTLALHDNRRDVASGVLCGSAPRLYDLTDQVRFS
jgi:hypothetical protein